MGDYGVNYTLAAAFSHFMVTIDNWNEMMADENDDNFQAFLVFHPHQQQQ